MNDPARYAARGAAVAEVVTERRSVWVRDRRTKAIVGYLADGVLVRIANAGELYARAMKQVRGEYRYDLLDDLR